MEMATKQETELKQIILLNKSAESVASAKLELRKIRREKEQQKYDCAGGILDLLREKKCKMKGRIFVNPELLMKIQISMCQQGKTEIPIEFDAANIEIENIE